MKLLYEKQGITDEASDKTLEAYSALTLISASCHGILNTFLIRPQAAAEKEKEDSSEDRFAWFDDVNGKLDQAKLVAKDWLDRVVVPIQSDIPCSVIQFDNQFQATVTCVKELCDKYRRVEDKYERIKAEIKEAEDAKKTGNADKAVTEKADTAEDIAKQTVTGKTETEKKIEEAECAKKTEQKNIVRDINDLLEALCETIDQDIVTKIEGSAENLKQWGTSLQTAHDNLANKVKTVQDAQQDIATDIERLNTSIDMLNKTIQSENTLVSVGAGLVGGGIFVAVVGVVLCATGVGAVAGGLTIGCGAAMVIGGATTWGIMQSRIDDQYKKIAEDRKLISSEKQLLASLKAIESGTTSAVAYMQTALSALDGVKTMWQGFSSIIKTTIKDLEQAENAAAIVQKKLFTVTAQKQWSDAHEMAQKLFDTKLIVNDLGTIGEEAA